MKRKCYLGIVMGLLLLLLCPMAVSAASSALPKKVYHSGTWKTQGGNKYYYYSGKKISGWAEIKGKTYYFNKDGVMKTGWLTYNKKKYYFVPKTGVMVTGFYTSSSGKYYYFSSSGEAKKGMFKVGNNTYYGNSNYVLKTNQWSKVSGRYYYFTSKGVRKYHWFTIGSRRYFCSLTSGKMTGWKKVEGDTYYFTNSGYVLTNQWITKGTQKWYVDGNGKVIRKVSTSALTNSDYDEIILVGDSRFYHAKQDYGIGDKNVTYVTKAGKGLGWFSGEEAGQSGFAILEKRVDETYNYNWKYYKRPGKIAIVLNLGVNDLRVLDLKQNGMTVAEVANRYVTYMKTNLVRLAQQYQCDLYYLSVNPVNEKVLRDCNLRKNADIQAFNNSIKTGLSSVGFRYIDTYSYLVKNYSLSQIASVDGVHFDAVISREIYNQIIINLEPKNP